SQHNHSCPDDPSCPQAALTSATPMKATANHKKKLTSAASRRRFHPASSAAFGVSRMADSVRVITYPLASNNTIKPIFVQYIQELKKVSTSAANSSTPVTKDSEIPVMTKRWARSSS